MSNELTIILSAYLIITFFFMLAIQFERVKNDFKLDSIQVIVSPFWPFILIWYVSHNIKKKIKRIYK